MGKKEVFSLPPPPIFPPPTSSSSPLWEEEEEEEDDIFRPFPSLGEGSEDFFMQRLLLLLCSAVLVAGSFFVRIEAKA